LILRVGAGGLKFWSVKAGTPTVPTAPQSQPIRSLEGQGSPFRR